ncbi:cytochrome P450 monooxygenase-like protein [Xylariales sp. PMI_506]|nr:cytochrome P450 monooxygenase-like protein [Xylariales sp. PMI_506]
MALQDLLEKPFPLEWSSMSLGLLIIVGSLLVYNIADAVYKLKFHPLAKFPGPRLAAFSNIPYSFWISSGRWPFKAVDLHKKYGPVVRITPTELSFSTAQSWKDIYGIRPGHKIFLKSEFYDGASHAGIHVSSIIRERDPEVHKEMHRLLSYGFSEAARAEQEQPISEILDLCVRKVEEKSINPAGFDIVDLLTIATFEVMGQMSFGTTFGSLNDCIRDPWISASLESPMLVVIYDVLSRYKNVLQILKFFFHRKIKEASAVTDAHMKIASDTVHKRMEMSPSHRDFLTRIIKAREQNEVSHEQIVYHVADLAIAGSETIVNSLSSCMYYLVRNPDKQRRLREELQAAFSDYREINSATTAPLKYLHAVISEAMRLYPPLPLGLPRVVPVGGDTVDGHFLPGGTVVSTNPLAASLSPANFHEPTSFIPERWIEDNQDDLDASQPFSYGIRQCLARNIAWMEVKLALSKLIWAFEYEPTEKFVNWHDESHMYLIWQKPQMFVHAKKIAPYS